MEIADETEKPTIVTAPCRLHFGLLSLDNSGQHDARSFGGLGAMIESPNVKVTVRNAQEFSCDGFDEEVIHSVVERWL